VVSSIVLVLACEMGSCNQSGRYKLDRYRLIVEVTEVCECRAVGDQINKFISDQNGNREHFLTEPPQATAHPCFSIHHVLQMFFLSTNLLFTRRLDKACKLEAQQK